MTSSLIIKACSVFESLSDADLEKISGVSREYEAGNTVFSVGDLADELYMVEEGKIALQIQLPVAHQPQLSRRVTVDLVTRGEVFGWSAVVEPHRYTMTAVCLGPTKVFAIDGVLLRALLSNDHHIGYKVLNHLIKVVASRLDETRQVLVSERLVSV